LFAAPLAAQTPNWEGKTILVKRTGIEIGYVEQGKDVVTDKIDEISYKVLDEQDGWIRIKTARGKTGWFLKSEAVVLDNAADFFTHQIKDNPKNGLAYQSRATALALNGQLDAALQDLDEAVKLSPKDALLYNSRGNLYARQKQYEKAIADYTKAIELDPKQ